MIGDSAGSLLELLIRINRDVAGALDLRTVLQRLILAAMQHVGGERASIIVVDDLGRPVDATIVYGTNLHEHTTKQLRETLDRGLAGWVIRNRKPALVSDTSLDERWLHRPDDAADQSGPKAALCVPLLARNQMVGALTIVHSLPGAFDSGHLELAQAIADQASIAVLNARLYSDSTRQARIMTALAEGAASFGSTLDLQEVWERVLNRTLQTLQAETAALGMLDDSTGQVVFRAAAGQNATGIVGHKMARDRGLVSEVLQKGRAVVVPNASEDARYVEPDRFQDVDARALIMAPIQAQGKVIGVLAVINPMARRFDVDAATVMQGLGGLAGATIRNAQLFEELERAQRHYLELFEESTDLVFLTDWEGKITENNRHAEQATGFTRERLISMGIGQLHHIDWNKVGKGFAALRRQGAVSYESTVQAADGRPVTVEVHARPFEFAAASSILWTLHDLTEREQLDELRTNLTAMIYHDLRSPLSNLVSSLDLLRGMTGSDPDIRSTLAIAEHSAERMSRLVNTLLDINRLEAGDRLISLTANRAEDLIAAAVRDVGPAAEARQHRIRTVLAPGLPEVQVDGDMLRRVLSNLLENAIKFSKASSEVEIGARLEGEWLHLWVQDQGPGIPPEDQKRIFEKFARLAGGRPAEAGLGLGLAFCQMAVQAHRGTIRVESQESKGARFIITLPVKAAGV
jgi:PAS domain S-box-containing protein